MAKRRHFMNDIKVIMRRKDRLNDESIGNLTLDDFEIEIDPKSVAAINEDTDQVYRGIRSDNIRDQIGYGKLKWVKQTDVKLDTTETSIGHPFKDTMAFYHVVPHSPDVSGSVPSWYQSRRSDNRAIYLIADGPLTVDVIIRGL